MLVAAWLNPDKVRPHVRAESLQAALARQPHSVLPHTSLPGLVAPSRLDTLAIGAVLGPVATPLGTWYFQAKSRKPGGRLRPFREVCESAKEKVLYAPADLYRNLEKDLRAVKSENSTAIAVQRRLLEADRPHPDSSDSPSYSAVRAERDRWLRSLKVDAFPQWPLRPPLGGENRASGSRGAP